MGTITQVSGRVNELAILLASVQEALANTQNTLLEERTQPAGNGNGAESARDRVKALWRLLQERVEQAASHPSIHGGTRAKYARMDRRGYWALVETLLNEGNLRGDRERWREAYLDGVAAKNKAEVSGDDVRRMERLETELRDVLPIAVAEASTPEPQPTLSPGVIMTPSRTAAASPRDQLRAGLGRASSRRADEQGPQPSA